MAAPYLQLNQKVEDAIKAVIDTLALSAGSVDYQCHTSLTQDDADIDYIWVLAETGEEVAEGLSNWRVEVAIHVMTNRDSGDHGHTWHDGAVGTIADKMGEDTIHDTLTAQVTDFAVIQVLSKGQGHEVDDRMWVTTLNYEVVACGVDLT